MAEITMTKPHTSGIALGGIGSGSAQLLPDGDLSISYLKGNPDDWELTVL